MRQIYKNPQFIDFSKIGNSSTGYISIAEKEKLPLEINRVYWTYYTPQDVTRGGHAHLKLKQIIVAVSGTITFSTEDLEGKKEVFILDRPDKGLFIPQKIWRDIIFSHNAVLLCLASAVYDEEDYIRIYEDFKKLRN